MIALATPQFSARRISVAVAATVLLLLLPPVIGLAWLLSPGQIRVRALINAYHAKAKHHAELERKYSRLSEYSDISHGIAIRGGRSVHIPVGQRPELIPRYLELAKYHGTLRRKYEDAEWHPRLPVEPDPPAPEP
jgi:hypothetical protein